MRYNHFVVPALVFAALVAVSANARAALTYFIDEVTDYGNGCDADDLNTVTTSLRSALDANGYTGVRYKNADAWPQDFMETCNSSLYGAGNDQADQRLLAIFAGHGNTGILGWGTKRDNVCLVNLGQRRSNLGVMRLGQMDHAAAGYGVWIASCVLKKSSLADNANYQWLNQQFGFHNSPAIEAHQPKDWFNAVNGGKSNKQAWLDELEDKQGLFTGDNSPMVVSYATSSSLCTQMHNSKRLVAQILTPRGGGPTCGGSPPAFSYCYTLRDNGGSSSCE